MPVEMKAPHSIKRANDADANADADTIVLLVTELAPHRIKTTIDVDRLSCLVLPISGFKNRSHSRWERRPPQGSGNGDTDAIGSECG